MTWWIGEVVLLLVGMALHVAVFTALMAGRSLMHTRAAAPPRSVPELAPSASPLPEEGA